MSAARIRARPRWLRAGAALGLVLGLVAAFGFVILPLLARHELPPRLSALLGRPVAIDDIGFNPFTLRLVVSGVRVGEREAPGPAAATSPPGLGLSRLEIDGSWRSLIERAPVISGVRLIEPTIRLVRDRQQRYNVEDLVQLWMQRPVSPDDTMPRFSLANLEIRDGRIDFEDQLLARTHRVSAVDVRLPFVSTLPVHQQVTIEPRVAMRIDDTLIAINGRSQPFSAERQSRLELSLAPTDLAPYLPYLPAGLPVRVLAGRVAAEVAVEFGLPVGALPTLTVTADGALTDLDLRDPGGEPLLAVASLQLKGLALRPLARQLVAGSLLIDTPVLSLQRRAGQSQFAQAVLDAMSGAAAVERAPFAWSIDELVVRQGRVAVRDQTTRPKALAVDVQALALRLGGLSQDLTADVAFDLAFGLGSGERIAAKGALRAQPMRVDADASVQGVALKQWGWLAAPWWQGELAGGVLSLQSSVHLEQGEAQWQMRLANLSAELKSLAIRQRWDQRELLRLRAVSLAGVDADLTARSLSVGRLSLTGGAIQVVRAPDGQLNWLRALSAPPAQQAVMPVAAAQPGGAAPAAPASLAAIQPSAPAPWRFGLKQLSIADLSAGLRDAMVAAGSPGDSAAGGALDLAGLSVQAQALGNGGTPPGQVTLRTRVGAAGMVDVKGSLGLDPVRAKLRLDARSIAVLPAQPYFEPYLNLVVASGNLSAQGELDLDLPPDRPVRAGWRGDIRMTDFDSAVKLTGEDLLRWRLLQLSGMDLALSPLKLDLGQIALSDFYTRLIISPAGRFNLQDLLAVAPPGATAAPAALSPPALAPAAAVPATALPITLGRITLTNGNIDFSDQFVKPNYSANLTGMTGSVSALAPDTTGQLDLRGRIDNAGSIEIAGRLNPLAAMAMLDLSARARDIDLPRTSPYAVKYLGYGIDKGKLSATLKYRIEGRQLQAENSIVLDQLTFGDKVDSPSATQLPVLFAVALLKDRHGVIDVNLPIGGSLDDPQFSVGGLVLKVIGNLIVKAVTAPFSLLASLAGSGESSSTLPFAPGLAVLDAGAHTRLTALATALADRPALRLDLAGHADADRDTPALRQQAFDRQLKSFKMRAMPGAGSAAAAGGLDAIRIEPDEYARYVTAAYRAGDFVKPRNAFGLLVELPVADMAARLLASIAPDPDALRRLANTRAQAAKEWLTAQGGIAGERLFLVAPVVAEVPAAAGAPTGDAVGVSLSLK